MSLVIATICEEGIALAADTKLTLLLKRNDPETGEEVEVTSWFSTSASKMVLTDNNVGIAFVGRLTVKGLRADLFFSQYFAQRPGLNARQVAEEINSLFVQEPELGEMEVLVAGMMDARCKIADGSVGVCRQHKNINGELYDESYGIVSSLSPDPVEKKPLNKFLPGTFTYSIGGFGCNMTCLHCQNYMISHEYDINSRGIKITPEVIVENALNYNCKSIAWTYNEPTIHLPFSKKTSLLARQKKLKVIYVSNGYYSGKSLEEVLTFVDAFNIDLKSMSQDFYKKVCGADLDVVLDNLKRIYLEGKHLEITNLIINDYNDSIDEITQLCDFVVTELGPEVPLHFSRAFPYYKMDNISPTRPEILYKAKEIAEEKGINSVYLGNI